MDLGRDYGGLRVLRVVVEHGEQLLGASGGTLVELGELGR
jgi:hypothetical protein